MSKADQDEWDDLCKTRDVRKEEVRLINIELEKLAAKTFIHHLSRGKWKVIAGGDAYSNYLDPADRETERVLVEIASVLFNLGYHDSFYLSQGDVHFRACVNDGELSIYIDFYEDTALESGKVLNLDIDLSDHEGQDERSTSRSVRRVQQGRAEGSAAGG